MSVDVEEALREKIKGKRMQNDSYPIKQKRAEFELFFALTRLKKRRAIFQNQYVFQSTTDPPLESE